MILWLRRSPTERPWCRAWLLSSHAITCSTRLTSKCTTSGTHTTRAVTDARIPDGRQHQKMTSWASMRYAVVDVEGNGQQPPDLVEVAVVPVAAGIIGAPASWLVKPPRPVSRIAARIHGLTNEALAAAPAFADIESEVREALDADVLVAHNAHVDVGVLRRYLGGWECPEVLDTLKLARRLLPGQVSYKLSAQRSRWLTACPPALSRIAPPSTPW
jgi:DNA polymerase III epsilon subunit-like protein